MLGTVSCSYLLSYGEFNKGVPFKSLSTNKAKLFWRELCRIFAHVVKNRKVCYHAYTTSKMAESR
jgi:hypothetical protein